jgi:hypothetical protein
VNVVIVLEYDIIYSHIPAAYFDRGLYYYSRKKIYIWMCIFVCV